MGANLPLEWEQSSSRAASRLPTPALTVLAWPRSLSGGCRLGPYPARLPPKLSRGSLPGALLALPSTLSVSSLKAGTGWGSARSK